MKQTTGRTHCAPGGRYGRGLLGLTLLGALLLVSASGVQGQVYAIKGGKIHTLAGESQANGGEPGGMVGTVVIRDGKITAVGPQVAVPDGAEVIDASGLEVYPGLFDATSRLGLVEIGSLAATQDTNELSTYNPHLVSATAIHPASEHLPVARANGITHTLAAPGGGGRRGGGSGGAVIPGQASLIHLSGWTVEEMLVEPTVGMVLNWPSIQTGTFDFSTFTQGRRPFPEAKKEHDRRIDELRDWLDAARHYADAKDKGSADKVSRDLKLEALARVVARELPVLVSVNDERGIREAVEFADEQGLKLILAGGRDAWKVKDLLREKGIPVILGPTQALPQEEDEPYDKPLTTPGELHAAGIKIAFATFNSSDSRTLPYEAANAVSYGLPWEEALRAITLNPAEIFGVADRLGSLEEGKIANLIVTDGDPLKIQTQVRYLFIRGQLTSTDNRHQRLYETYRARP